MDCIFCRIVAGEVPARVVRRTDLAVAFHDVHPQAPQHLLVVPTVHAATAAEVVGQVGGEAVIAAVVQLAVEVARELGLEADGYRMVINTGRAGGQTVDHLHLHLLGGRQLTWPPG